MRLFGAFLLLLLLTATGRAQGSAVAPTAAPRHGPVRTIKIGKTSFNYYEQPEAVVAAASFYISGSELKSVWFDFVAMTAMFYNSGPRLTTPSIVRFNIFSATYRDGCKYRDKYADKATQQLHLNVLADEKSLFATDVNAAQVGELESRHGHVCNEMYVFEMTYQQFLTLMAARKAEVRLGERRLKLKDEHLDALRTMKNGIGQY